MQRTLLPVLLVACAVPATAFLAQPATIASRLRAPTSHAIRQPMVGPSMLLVEQQRLMPLLPAAKETSAVPMKMASTSGGAKKGIDVQLIIYFALWYLGNYYCKLPVKVACALDKFA